jgi:threonine/homoserine/homoserine lactone efflux protein
MTTAQITEALALGVSAFVIGLTGAMAPGPYLTVTITRTMEKGRLSAMLMLVGHALLEGLLLVGFAFGLQNFLARPTVTTFLAVVGGGFLVWMGASLLRGAVKGTVSPEARPEKADSRFGPIVQGATVSLSNPYWTLWWVTIGVKLASDGLAIGAIGVAAFFIGHQLADIAWYGAVIMAVSSGRRILSDKLYRGIIGTCAAFLLYLGASFIIDGISGISL